jgi:hypothetical protein
MNCATNTAAQSVTVAVIVCTQPVGRVLSALYIPHTSDAVLVKNLDIIQPPHIESTYSLLIICLSNVKSDTSLSSSGAQLLIVCGVVWSSFNTKS